MPASAVAIVPQFGAASASTRYRALAFADALRAEFDRVDVLLPREPRPGSGTTAGRMRLAGELARGWLARRRELARALPGYDAVLVQRGVFGAGPGGVVAPVERFAGRVVLDIDDAVWLEAPALAAGRASARRLYGPQQTLRLIDRADAIVAASEELARVLPAGRSAAAVLPTMPDPDRYPLADPAREDGSMSVVWAGNAGNLGCLELVREPFARLTGDATARLTVVSSEPWTGPAHFEPWRVEAESTVFAAHAVGIMPLPDTPYTRAKAGFKLMQYLAAGLPVIASPVGVNAEIVTASGAGRLARDEREWEAALRELAADPALRAELGRRGRTWLEARADPAGHAHTLARLLRGEAAP